jgi:hypothetical protein
MTVLVVGVILFIPIGRYSLPFDLPFQLETYRIIVAVVLAAWLLALLTDSNVHLRRSPFDGPIAVVVAATLGSVVVNTSRVVPLESAVLKSVTFFLSFILTYYFIVSVVRSKRTLETVTKFLVVSTAIVAVAAIGEQRTDFNAFDHVSTVVPILQFEGQLGDEAELRYGYVRAIASAEHPIALGVLFAIVLPIAVALAASVSRGFWIPTGLIMLGVLSSASRTAVIVAFVTAAVFLWIKPRDVVRALPLAAPAALLVMIAVPSSINSLVDAFTPEGGLVAQATAIAPESDPLLAGGRVRQIGPTLELASQTPLLGQGFGTRQTGVDNPLRNAPILDNQWLALLLEIGLVGVLGWVLLFVVSVRRLARFARSDLGSDSDRWLAAGFAASVTGFGFGMLTYDAFAFTQVTFVLWVILALSAVLLLRFQDEGEMPRRSTAPRRS